MRRVGTWWLNSALCWSLLIFTSLSFFCQDLPGFAGTWGGGNLKTSNSKHQHPSPNPGVREGAKNRPESAALSSDGEMLMSKIRLR